MVRVQMLAEGRATREIVKELGLSFTQLKELRGVFPRYVEVRELEEGPRSLEDEYLQVLQRIEKASSSVKTLEDLKAYVIEKYKGYPTSIIYEDANYEEAM